MNAGASTVAAEWRPRANPWLIALAVMLATFMVILDTSIAVVALPYIAGNLGATQDESTWVLTSYLVANAVSCRPAPGSPVFSGEEHFLIACTIIFTVASDFAALPTSMTMLVSPASCRAWAEEPCNRFRRPSCWKVSRRPNAARPRRLFGLAIVVAPIIGPTLGRLADRQVVLALDFLHQSARRHPRAFLMSSGRRPALHSRQPTARIDGMGFALMALFLGTLQIVLDKGQDADWFGAVWLRWFAVISAVSLIGFIVREFLTDHPIVDLRVFKNRNFAVSAVLFGLFGLSIYALITLQPLFLQSLLGLSRL